MDHCSSMQFCSHQQMSWMNPETTNTDIFSYNHLSIFRVFKNKNPSV
ncbi:lactate dehydrogenase [Hoylesella buccalis]|uniref:Lactate dehydrogenase n=1 Tax=Hoylesella buccalis TaxID=28127 RepID=A0A2N6QQ05_9BACT|nr:lactate dehydrogenase [Hoylesella buccalis]